MSGSEAMEAAAVLQERGKESLALTMLLDTAELTHLRLAWEIWAGLVADRGGSADMLLSRSLAPMALDRCRLALWGQTSPGGRSLRLVGE